MPYPQRLRALPDKAERLAKANEFIQVIASTGRRFFFHQGAVSLLLLDGQGRIVLLDCYSKRYVYTHYEGYWKGFTGGGEGQVLILRLREYVQGKIETGDELFINLPIHWNPSRLGGMEELLAGYDHPWGYPEDDMTTVIEAARRIFCQTAESHESQPETAP